MSADRQDLPMILLPGLNGDPRVLGPQARAFSSLRIATRPRPEDGESLAAYARRFAHSLHRTEPCLIGGVSFGGIVALEASRHLPSQACLLIASTRDPAGLPTFVRRLRPLAALLPRVLSKWAIQCGFHFAAASVKHIKQRVARWSPEERSFRQWALRALLTWRAPRQPACPVFQIHGERDATFDASRSKADIIVPDAGHMLTLTHAEAVNEFLQSALRQYTP